MASWSPAPPSPLAVHPSSVASAAGTGWVASSVAGAWPGRLPVPAATGSRTGVASPSPGEGGSGRRRGVGQGRLPGRSSVAAGRPPDRGAVVRGVGPGGRSIAVVAVAVALLDVAGAGEPGALLGRAGRGLDPEPGRGGGGRLVQVLLLLLDPADAGADLVQHRLQVTVDPAELLQRPVPQGLQPDRLGLDHEALALGLLPDHVGGVAGLLQHRPGVLLGLGRASPRPPGGRPPRPAPPRPGPPRGSGGPPPRSRRPGARPP